MDLIKSKISTTFGMLGFNNPHVKFCYYMVLGVTATGSAAKLVWYLIRRQISKVREESMKTVFVEYESDGVNVETLGALCKSNNTNLRRCAEQLVTERFVNNSHALNKIFHNCLHGNKDQIHRACTILCHGTLFSEVESWPLGFDKAVIHTLGKVLINSIEPDYTDNDLYRERIQKMASAGLLAASSIFGNVYSAKEPEDPIVEAFLPELCGSLLHLIRVSRDRDVQRFCLIIINHMIIDGAREDLVYEAGGVSVITHVFATQLGDVMFQKMCLQLLIVFLRLRVTDDKNDPRKHIADQNIIRHLVSCLRSDDMACVNCGAAVLYQLVSLCRQEIVTVPGLVRVFGRNLSSNDAKLQWLILRIVFMLAVEDAKFKHDVLECNEILERLSSLYLSGETEVVSSALALTDCILLEGKEAVMKVLNASDQLIPNLSMVISHREPLIQRMLAEILGLICTCEESVLKAVDFGIVPAILQFAQITQQSTSDSDLVFHATAMLLNLAMTSDGIKCEILTAGGLSILMELAIELGNRTNISVVAAKSLIMLGYTDHDANIRVECNKDGARVIIGKKRAVFLGSALHVVTWNLSTNQLRHDASIHAVSDLIQIKKAKDVGTTYILVINASPQFNQDLQKASFMFSEEGGGHSIIEAAKDHAYTILVGQFHDNKFIIKHHYHSDNKEHTVTNFNLSYNDIVNQYVSDLVVQPAVKSISMSPVTSPVSKVSELEILQVLCHHEDHRNTVLHCEMMLNDLRDMVRIIGERLHRIEELEPIHFAHSLAALEVLVVLAIDGRFCKFATNKKFIPVLIDLLHSVTRLWLNSAVKGLTVKQEHLCSEYHEVLQNLAKHALLTLYQFINVTDPQLRHQIKPILQKEGAVLMVWSLLLCAGSVLKTAISVSASSVVLSLCCEDPISNPPTCLLNKADKTPSLQLSPNQLWARNDSWTFESVRANHGADFRPSLDQAELPEGWYFEAIIHSKGIIQIGWATENSFFSPQKGLGVGDNNTSVAFDGERCKKWNGPLTEQLENTYGEPWKDGDTVGCLMTKTGTVSYTLEGKDLGIAYTDLDANECWYPATSLATDQCVEFNFGATAFKHQPPAGFISMADVASRTSQGGADDKSVDETEDVYEELKDNLIPLSQQSKCYVPTLYFEVNLPLQQREPLHLGMMYLDDPIKEKLYITYCQNKLILPDGRKIADIVDDQIPVTLGVGYLFHQSTVFFVVDGSPIKKTFSLPRSNKPLIPYLNCRVVDVNFGMKYFVYDPANDRTIRLSCAALLHDYYDLYCHTSSRSSGRTQSH